MKCRFLLWAVVGAAGIIGGGGMAHAELTAEQVKEAEALIVQLSQQDPAVRREAVIGLMEMGPEVLPLVTKALAETEDAETKQWCELVIKAITLEERRFELKKQYEGKLEELRKRGEPVTFKELAGPEVPEAENAAPVYEKAFQEYDRLSEEVRKRISELAVSRPLTPEEVVEAKDLVEQAGGVIDLLHKAALRKQCRFAVDQEETPEAALAFLSRVQAIARLLRLSAKVNTDTAKPDDAMADCAGIIKLGGAAEAKPRLISMLVDLAMRGIARKGLTATLNGGEPSPEALRQYLGALGNVDSRGRLQKALRGERCLGLYLFQGMMQDPAAPGAPFTYSQGIVYLDAMEKCIEMAGKPWVQCEAGWAKLGQKIAKDTLVGSLVAALGRGALTYDRSVAIDGVSQLAVALRLYRIKHGEYPEKLAALTPEVLAKLPTDPFSGKDYVYRREGKGFVVYSIGEDGVDDGGEEGSGNTPDIVVKCSR